MEPQNSIKKESCFKKWWWKNWYPLLHTIHKSQVKIDDRFKCFNFKGYKNLEENIGENNCDFGLSKYFLDTTLNA